MNAANEAKIKQAKGLLDEVLASIGGQSQESEDDDKTLNVADVKTVVPYADHGKADEGASWSAPSLSDFTSDTFDVLTSTDKTRIMAHFAWSANVPPNSFGDLKLPHHAASKSGVGPAIWRGVAATNSSKFFFTFCATLMGFRLRRTNSAA